MSAGHPYQWRIEEIRDNAPELDHNKATRIARASAAAHACGMLAQALSVNLTNEGIQNSVRLTDAVQGGIGDAITILAELIDDDLHELAESFAPKGAKR